MERASLRQVRKKFLNGEYISTEEIEELLPQIESSMKTLYGLGEEFYIIGNELLRMSLSLGDMILARKKHES